jgi:hypothetical protein
MKRPVLLALVAAVLLAAQLPEDDEKPKRLPDGRSQSEAILKADYERSKEDVAELVKLSEELRMDLEKNEQHVLSIASLRKVEKIEELARRIKKRMKRF